LVERWVMGANRDRLARRLKKADRFDRLRIVHAVVPAKEGEREVFIHSKVVIVDDEFLRVGSSNLNNRSTGLDTECDLAIEAANETTQRAIARVRSRLLGEHLDVAPEAVDAAVAREGSLIRAIDSLNRNPRGLRRLPDADPEGPTRSFPGTRFLDPKEPFRPLRFLRRESRARLSGLASSVRALRGASHGRDAETPPR
jgi:phosphatidylserine/phosphatidylglycerophosphate/cardiolipin synthase-like enzyme